MAHTDAGALVAPLCVDKQGAAHMLARCVRSFDKRHTWFPKFPAPVRRRPLAWRISDVADWLDLAASLAQRGK